MKGEIEKGKKMKRNGKGDRIMRKKDGNKEHTK